MKASDYIAWFLAEQGVERVYEMCGGMITHLLDSLAVRGEIRVISMHHEQAAGFAAEAEARMTGVPGVAMATSGPGATNLVTAIGSCYFDSVPTVFITGQVNTFEQRGASGVRQSGFQETDIVAVAGPIAKAAWSVRSAEELPATLDAAFRVALEGRPGPVLLDIAMDVQRSEVDAPAPTRRAAPERVSPPVGAAAQVATGLASAARPLILAGGGVRSARITDAVHALARSFRVPVVNSLPGVDVMPADDPLRVGLIGTYGNRWANEAFGRADYLLVLGSRLDVRQTGANVLRFVEGKTIVRVDVDEAELAHRVPASTYVNSDLAVFVSALLQTAPVLPQDRTAWLDEIERLREASPDETELAGTPGINPAVLMHELSRLARDASAFVADVGQNQIWAAQSLRLTDGQRFLTSAGMGAMGFSLPAAIGAAFASSPARVIALMGDGGAQVNIQELETVARHALPLKCVILDNGCLGMVRQFQDEYFEGRHSSTVEGYGAPAFARVAEAYGIPAQEVHDPSRVIAALEWLLSSEGPSLLHVHLDRTSYVSPKVSFGNPVFVMERPAGQGAVDE